MRLDFGTSAGGDEIGTSLFVSTFSFAVNNVTSTLIPAQVILASLGTLFVTMVYVDDNYSASSLALELASGRRVGGVLQVSDVPLPAALPLFLMGLAGLGFSKKRNRRLA